MKKLILETYGQPLKLVDTPDPQPEHGQVVVELEAAPVNPSDLLLAGGIYGVRPELPSGVGGEGVGRVVRVGPGSDATLLGRRVLVLSGDQPGSWAEQIALDENSVVPVSETADPLQLAMLSINPATAYLLLQRYARLMPGDWIAQTAANSGAGQSILQLARLAGVKTLNIVRREEAATYVRELGGDAVVVEGDGLQQRIADALGGRQLSLVLDPVGGPVSAVLAGFVKFGGAVVSYGLLSGLPTTVPVPDLVYREVTLHGFWLMNWMRHATRAEILETYQKLGEHVESGALQTTVHQTYPLTDFQKAIDEASAYNRNGKVLFTLKRATDK